MSEGSGGRAARNASPEITQAIAREKQLKSWRRSKKVELIETLNPEWKDLAEGMSLRARTS